MKIQDKTLSFERLPLELRDPRTKNGGSHTERNLGPSQTRTEEVKGRTNQGGD